MPASNLSKILVGTSGWGYPEWKGPFYPPNLPDEVMLDYYTRVFSTCEINTTFYHNPRRQTIEKWARKIPTGFDFAVKLPKQLSHDLKLDPDQVEPPLHEFLSLMNPLAEGNKISTFLLQLPPKFDKEGYWDALEHFLDLWERTEIFQDPSQMQLAVELRNTSWLADEEVFTLLKRHRVAYTIVIEPLLPPVIQVTSEQAYVRFHGFGTRIWFDYEFRDEELDEWVPKIETISSHDRVKRVNIYFNNHFSGYAAKNALEMITKLGLKPRSDPAQLDPLEFLKTAGKVDKSQKSLDNFFKKRAK